MAWIRHVPSVIASSLLFQFIGTPLGTATFFVILHVTADKPVSYRNFVEFMLTAGIAIAVIAGAAPAFVTGLAAGIVRIYVRSLLLFGCLMAAVGAAATASYIALLEGFFFRHGLVAQEQVILTGSITAFCCAFLLWRDRPWTILDRPQRRAESSDSLRRRYRRMRSLWAGLEP